MDPETRPMTLKMDKIHPAKKRLMPNSARMIGNTGGAFPT